MEPQVRLRPDEASLFEDLIDYRDRSQLAGRYDDEFLVAFVANDGDLTHPSLAGSRRVSMRSLRRYESLGLIDILSRTDAAISFDLADNVRERWGALRGSLRPQAEDAVEREPTLPSASSSAPKGIFISCSELRKAVLARPFRELLSANGLRGFIVSDEPLPDGSWTPEQKVDAYLDRSDAVVVFATADIESGTDRYTRPNIADEIARARSKPRLRDRLCVLKERGVTLPSNINPAYESLDLVRPAEAFQRAFLQLREWGFGVTEMQLEPEPAGSAASIPTGAGQDLSTAEQEELVARAQRLLPDRNELGGRPSLAVVIATASREPVLRPSELESPSLGRRLTQEVLFGDPALFEPTEGTKTAMSGASLVIRQAGSWIALDGTGTLVVVRPLHRTSEQRRGMTAIIEDDVRADIEQTLRFATRVLSEIDPGERASSVAPLVALIDSKYGAWRTAAEQAASPNTMTMNMSHSGRPTATLVPPARGRGALLNEAAEIADDLTVLLRRAALS